MIKRHKESEIVAPVNAIIYSVAWTCQNPLHQCESSSLVLSFLAGPSGCHKGECWVGFALAEFQNSEILQVSARVSQKVDEDEVVKTANVMSSVLIEPQYQVAIVVIAVITDMHIHINIHHVSVCVSFICTSLCLMTFLFKTSTWSLSLISCARSVFWLKSRVFSGTTMEAIVPSIPFLLQLNP